MRVPPSIIHFAIVNHPFWGTPIYGNHHILNDFVYEFLKEPFSGRHRGSVACALRPMEALRPFGMPCWRALETHCEVVWGGLVEIM